MRAVVNQLITKLENIGDNALLYKLFPDEGELRRELYPRHIEFFKAGSVHQERAFIAGNRTGKTMAVCYEATCHALGWYPPWWIGRKFDARTHGWAAGEDAKAVRESLEPTLFGPPEARGTGMIPANLLERITPRSGVPGAVDFAVVRHPKGSSRIVMKTYDQKRESFQGAKIDWGIADEEPDIGIYTEFLTRTMATVPGEQNGLLMCSFTPLKGISQTVLLYLPGGAYPETEELRKLAWGW